MERQGSTLVGTERRLAAPTLVALITCLALGIWLLAHNPQPALVLAWLLPTASNAQYLVRHRSPSVGMVPVAIFSLLPAFVAGMLAAGQDAALFACCAVGVGVCACVVAAFAFWFARLARVCHAGTEVAEDALVVVLGGKIVRGVPARTLAQRLDVGARLCAEHPGRRLVLSGGVPASESISEAEAMARYLLTRGVAREQLVLEKEARNTRENLAYSLALVRERGLRGQLCVLSSDYHLWRALQEGKRLGVELVPVPAPTPWGSLPQQWSREVLTIWFSGR